MINQRIVRPKTLVFALLATSITTITAMLPSEIGSGTLVKFNWSDKNQRAQLDEEVIRRAEALDGQLAVIMNTPLWPNGNRVLIQSINDSDLTLAVKCTHLEKVEPMEITLIHAQHDRLLSDEYLNKEEEINNSNEYDVVLTVHPDTQSAFPVENFGNSLESIVLDSLFFYPELDWFFQQDASVDVDDTMNRLKDSTKMIWAKFIWQSYTEKGESIARRAHVDLMRMNNFPQDFQNIFMIQLNAVARSQTFRNMDWLPNDKISMEFVLLCFRLFQIRNDAILRAGLREMFEIKLEDASPMPHPMITRMKVNALERATKEYVEMDQALRQDYERVNNLSPSGLRKLLVGLQDCRRYCQAKLRTIRSEDVFCGVAKVLELNRDRMEMVQMTHSYGKSVAIVVPGDLVPVVSEEHFVTVLRGIIGMFRWRKRCKLYSITI